MARKFGIVVYGATGFTGKLVSEYLARVAPPTLKWAIAGRSASKLADVKQSVEAVLATREEPGLTVDTVVASTSDPASLEDLAKQTSVVITLVGPYTLYGEPLVRACVTHRTDYVDLTGETTWYKAMLDKYGADAKAGGTFLVCASGFDSIPSDLGAFLVADYAAKTHGVKLASVRSYYSIAGGASGGTIASAFEVIKWKNLKALGNGVLLCEPHPSGRPVTDFVASSRDAVLPSYSSSLKKWIMPFVMASTNTRVVRRSASLFAGLKDGGYGGPTTPFVYQEMAVTRSFFAALFTSIGLLLTPFLLLFPPTRWFLKKVVPKPGSGPSPETRAKSRFTNTVVATADSTPARVYTAQISGGDPGYGETSKMIAEAGLALALQRAELPGHVFGGGFLTPATCFGNVLVDRLGAAGMTLLVREGQP